MSSPETYWQLEKDFYTLTANHDLVIRVIEHAPLSRFQGSSSGVGSGLGEGAGSGSGEGAGSGSGEGGGDGQGDGNVGAPRVVTESVAVKVLELKVARGLLATSSTYFAKRLSEDDNNNNSNKDTLEIHTAHATALTLWLKISHSVADTDASTTHHITLTDVWHMLAVARKYGFHTRSAGAKAWFASWYAVHSQPPPPPPPQQQQQQQGQGQGRGTPLDYRAHQKLLLPCYAFDHAGGFRAATRYLVYRSMGAIQDRQPAGFFEEKQEEAEEQGGGVMGLDPEILAQLNAAKARLKTVLHRGLYRPVEALVRHGDCRCRGEVLWAYENLLTRQGCWPLETAWGGGATSVEAFLRRLERIPAKVAQPRTCGGRVCTFGFGDVVARVRVDVMGLFDGLCLDCMASSTPNFPSSEGQTDDFYWSKVAFRSGPHWDDGCRVRHHQPTWYFSFLGDRGKMQQWVEERREIRQGTGYRYHGGDEGYGRSAAGGL
ncbi:hypothetical protein B0A55_08961 [Friedmanniomyces simplex]|uniref:BTB domain-containing protein n=1 Tax=Friedmanniomyces simplex TaxID=329884 RepID=A0A4U0X0C1_9PEZI|nr:hypothetical protein B0A55_08961 [Friedmanniomyces simplex]